MEIIKYPQKNDWDEIIKRPVIDATDLIKQVGLILADVQKNGDQALYRYSKNFDNLSLKVLQITKSILQQSGKSIENDLKNAIKIAFENIDKFHREQLEEISYIDTMPGIRCWRKNVPIDKVGLYVPGGSAPLFSTLLMLAVPARIAGCSQIIVCTPPNKNGGVDPSILYSAKVLGIEHIYTVGGAQAIAAMTFGTETIPRVDKIFGPGNQYVTAAKQLASLEGIAIDLPAGPSEVAVIADQSARPEFIASDLLAQAEHGPDSQVILVTNSETILQETTVALRQQLDLLPRKKIAEQSLSSAKFILVDTLQSTIDLINKYAPEHLIIATKDALNLSEKVTCAGSVFVGNYSCESAGDYASGTNHTLPTNGYARNYSGVSLDSFYKKITFQEIQPAGLEQLGPHIEVMARAENLDGHANSVKIRREYLKQKGK